MQLVRCLKISKFSTCINDTNFFPILFKMYTILSKLDKIDQHLQTYQTPYRGTITSGSTYFIKSDSPGWVPATAEQVKAFNMFLEQDQTTQIYTSPTSYFNFRFIGSGQSDRRYAIQDRTPPHVFREIQSLPDDGFVGKIRWQKSSKCESTKSTSNIFLPYRAEMKYSRVQRFLHFCSSTERVSNAAFLGANTLIHVFTPRIPRCSRICAGIFQKWGVPFGSK